MSNVYFNQPINRAERDRCCLPLVGLQLSSVQKVDYAWYFVFTDGSLVQALGSWRLIGDKGILTSSDDHDQQFGLPSPVDAARRASSKIGGRQVIEAAISATSGDLIIEFGRKVFLELLQMSTGYEAWTLRIRDEEYVCEGGGRICRVVPSRRKSSARKT